MTTPETWLRIGAETSELVQKAPVVLRIGTRKIADRHLRHDPPTPLELENAIAAVEDEIGRVHTAISRNSRLRTRDAIVGDIARDAGVPPGAELALQAVEQAFQRLPSRAMGREKAAALLILRELMHHLGFAAIEVREKDLE